MPLKDKRRTKFVAFGRVVIDHVENDLDAGGMKMVHHGLKLGGQGRLQVARLRREKRKRVVTPIIAKALIDEIAVVDESVNRKEFGGRDAETSADSRLSRDARALQRCRARSPARADAVSVNPLTCIS